MKLFCTVSLLAISLLSFSQSSKYNLGSLLNKVIQNYPSIKARQANINAANYYLKAANKDRLPDLIIGDQYQYSTSNGLEGSYYSNEGTAISTSGGARDHNIYQGSFGSFTTLMVNWHAFDFGKVREAERLARTRIDLAKVDYENEVFQQQIKVADAYMLFVLSNKLVAVQENNLKRSLSFQQYITSRTLSGLLPGVDSSSANAEVARARLTLLQSQQFVELQKNNLEQLTDVPADSILIDTINFLRKVPSLDPVAVSIDKHPLLVYARDQLELQHIQLNMLKKSVLPTINILGVGWARGSGFDRVSKIYNSSLAGGIPYQTYNYMAGVAVKWNIQSLIKNKQQYAGMAQEIEGFRYRLDEETGLLNKEIKNARLQYLFSFEQTRVTPVQYKAALDAYNLSNARYQSGLSSLTEVIQAYYVLNRADVDNAVSVSGLWRALIQYAAATGNLFEFTSQLPK